MQGKLEKYPSNIDPVLKTLIMKCLEKDEAKRLEGKDILQFQNDLELQTYGYIKSSKIIENLKSQ